MVAEKKTSKKQNEAESKDVVSKKVTKAKVVKSEVLDTKVKSDVVNTKKTSKPKKVKAEVKAKVKTETKADNLNANYNPVDEVLQIKAKNDEKAMVKSQAKTTKKAVKKEKTETLADKVNVAKKSNKREEVKENVLKAEAKKFKQLKEEAQKEECSHLSIWTAFVAGYKNMFTYKARASRYDYWAFMLANFVFCLVFLGGLVALGNVATPIVLGSTFLIFVAVQLFVYLALMVRRLHDTGHNAWKGFFAPMTYSALAYLTLSYVLKYMSFNDASKSYVVFGLALSVFNLILALINSYYLIKTYIVASFIEEDKNANEFGLYRASDMNKTIFFASLYFVLTFVAVAVVNIMFISIAMPYIRY